MYFFSSTLIFVPSPKKTFDQKTLYLILIEQNNF